MIVLIAYLVFFIATFARAFSIDRVFGLFYAALFVYSLFALFGYLYLPGLSESIGAYFGDQVGHQAAVFCLLSLVGFYFVNSFIIRNTPNLKSISLTIGLQPGRLGMLFFIGISASFALSTLYYFSQLSWYIHELAGSLEVGLQAYLAAYKISVGVIAACYVLIRSGAAKGRLFVVIYLIYVAAFIVASVRLGNRTDPAALMIGALAYELSRRNFSLRTLFWAGAGASFAVVMLSLIEYFRYTIGGSGDRDLITRVVQNDYYAPAHMLFAAIAYNFTDVGEVFASNTSNALVLLNYPYLQETVTNLFRPDIATRSAGYAFYIFAEGWIAFGQFGFIYNWFVPTAGLTLWRWMACTNNKLVNDIILAVTACMILNLVRGQSSYFIKYLYTFVIPSLIVLAVIMSIRPAVQQSRTIG